MPVNTATIVQQFLTKRRVGVFGRADYFWFPEVKSFMKGQRYDWTEAIETAIMRDVNVDPQEAFRQLFDEVYKRCKSCAELTGDYI